MKLIIDLSRIQALVTNVVGRTDFYTLFFVTVITLVGVTAVALIMKTLSRGKVGFSVFSLIGYFAVSLAVFGACFLESRTFGRYFLSVTSAIIYASTVFVLSCAGYFACLTCLKRLRVKDKKISEYPPVDNNLRVQSENVYKLKTDKTKTRAEYPVDYDGVIDILDKLCLDENKQKQAKELKKKLAFYQGLPQNEQINKCVNQLFAQTVTLMRE